MTVNHACFICIWYIELACQIITEILKACNRDNLFQNQYIKLENLKR